MEESVNKLSETDTHGKKLTFELASERYGIDILQIQEIMGVTAITRVPKSPTYIKGVINLRGRIIPVMDLRIRLGLEGIPYNNKTCIIVVNMERNGEKVSVGIIVDTVLEVLDFSHEEVEAAPDYGSTIDTSFIRGIGRKSADNLNILIDINELMTDEDTAAIATSSKEMN